MNSLIFIDDVKDGIKEYIGCILYVMEENKIAGNLKVDFIYIKDEDNQKDLQKKIEEEIINYINELGYKNFELKVSVCPYVDYSNYSEEQDEVIQKLKDINEETIILLDLQLDKNDDNRLENDEKPIYSNLLYETMNKKNYHLYAFTAFSDATFYQKWNNHYKGTKSEIKTLSKSKLTYDKYDSKEILKLLGRYYHE